MCTCCSASSTFLLLHQHRSLHQNQSRTSHPGPQSQPEFFHDSLFQMGSSRSPQVLPMCPGRRQPARAWPPRLQSALSFVRSRPCTSTQRGSRGPVKINIFSICLLSKITHRRGRCCARLGCGQEDGEGHLALVGLAPMRQLLHEPALHLHVALQFWQLGLQRQD